MYRYFLHSSRIFIHNHTQNKLTFHKQPFLHLTTTILTISGEKKEKTEENKRVPAIYKVPASERWWRGEHWEIGVEKARDCRVAIVVQRRKKERKKEKRVDV